MREFAMSIWEQEHSSWRIINNTKTLIWERMCSRTSKYDLNWVSELGGEVK